MMVGVRYYITVHVCVCVCMCVCVCVCVCVCLHECTGVHVISVAYVAHLHMLYMLQIVCFHSTVDAGSGTMLTYRRTCLASTWFSMYSWIVSTPHSVPAYTSCT